MKKILILLIVGCVASNCKTNRKKEMILRNSVGNTNTILTVIKAQLWDTKVGDEIRTVFGEHQVGLPQPETTMSMSQVDPIGFTDIMNNNRAIMMVNIGEKEGVSVIHDKFAKPQTIISVVAKNEPALIKLIKEQGEKIITLFKEQDIKFSQNIFKKQQIDEQKFETVKNLDISLTIPNSFRVVKDSIGFLWLRQHLKSGIARGDGSNNILLYSIPLEDESKVSENITSVRDMIGKKHIPGSKEGMYMVTEEAYTPHIFDSEIDGHKAYETRGKWEVKGDFMAGPFINYSIIDKTNKRLIVFEGFTYAPSVNKRDFIFELEAIAKSIKFNSK